MTQMNAKGAHISSEFLAEVVFGSINGYSYVRKFGQQADLDTADGNVPVWNVKTLDYPFPTSGSTISLVSSSAADLLASSGASQIRIFGIGNDWAYLDEYVTMNGTDAVVTSGTYRRIFRMYTTLVGAHDANVGDITATHGASTIAQIDADAGQTLMCIYTIASGTTGYLTRTKAAVIANSNTAAKSATFQLRTNDRAVGGGTRLRATVGTKDRFLTAKYDFPVRIPQMNDVWITATAIGNDTFVTAGFDLLLVPNE